MLCFFFFIFECLGATPEKPEESDTDQPNGDELDEPSVEKKAPIEKPEIISWRRKPEDDGRPSSPTRKRFSPDRSRRPSGLYLILTLIC